MKKLIWGKDIGCLSCIYFNIYKWATCKAFLGGIPHQIISCEIEHDKPLPDQDNDIVFEPIKE